MLVLISSSASPGFSYQNRFTGQSALGRGHSVQPLDSRKELAEGLFSTLFLHKPTINLHLLLHEDTHRESGSLLHDMHPSSCAFVFK